MDDDRVSGLDQISLVVVAYAGVVVLAAGFAALRTGARPSWLDSMVWFLELLAAVRAVAGVGSLLSGHGAAEQTAYVGYLIASVCIIPIALASFRPAPDAEEQTTGDPASGSAQEDRGIWSVGVVAVAALAVGVIAVRTMMTL